MLPKLLFSYQKTVTKVDMLVFDVWICSSLHLITSGPTGTQITPTQFRTNMLQRKIMHLCFVYLICDHCSARPIDALNTTLRFVCDWQWRRFSLQYSNLNAHVSFFPQEVLGNSGKLIIPFFLFNSQPISYLRKNCCSLIHLIMCLVIYIMIHHDTGVICFPWKIIRQSGLFIFKSVSK